MEILNMHLPKSSGIDKIKKEFDEFILYYEKVKRRKPERLHLGHEPAVQLRKALKALKLTPEYLTYQSIPVVEL